MNREASLSNPSAKVLLVVDMQRDVLQNGYEVPRVVERINMLVARARSANTPVIWVQHADEELVPDSPGWEIIEALAPGDGEPVVHKNWGDSFEDTGLHALLAEHSVGHIVVTGAQTEWCIRSTLHGAHVRGYDTTLVTDAHTTDKQSASGSPVTAQQAIDFTNMYWNHTSAPGRTCAAVAAADVTF